MTRPYRLATHIHACISKQGTVLLDVIRDRYLGLDPAQAAALTPLVEGWPATDVPATTEASPIEPDFTLAEELRALGVLEPGVPEPASSVASATSRTTSHGEKLPAAECELMSWAEMSSDSLRPHHLLSFLWSMGVAFLALKAGSLNKAVQRQQRRHRRSGGALDMAQARRHLTAYTYLRMCFFARRARCLFDSLVLMEFLALYGIHPRWIIGVRMRPFGAHSWVQFERYVLNGTPGFVCHYQPILVI